MEMLPLIDIAGAAGALAIGAAGLALLSSKGDSLHVTAGRGFLVLIALSGLATIVAATWNSDTYSLLLAIFALYFAQAGWRWAAASGFSRVDRAVTSAMLIGGLAMIATAIACLAGGYTVTVSRETAPMVASFGVLGVFAARRNFIDFERQLAWSDRILRHGLHMIAAFILTAIAFAISNSEKLGLQPWMAIALPLVLIAPLGAFELSRFRQGKGRTV